MELRPLDRLMLLMLSEIYDRTVGTEGEFDTDFIRSVVFGGHDWAFDWDLPGVTQVETDRKEHVDEVIKILDMFRRIAFSVQHMSDTERRELNDVSYEFAGFDGNDESEHLSIARFLTQNMGRWPELKDQIVNSHSSTLAGYRAMLARYDHLKASLGTSGPDRLSAAQIKEIVDA